MRLFCLFFLTQFNLWVYSQTDPMVQSTANSYYEKEFYTKEIHHTAFKPNYYQFDSIAISEKLIHYQFAKSKKYESHLGLNPFIEYFSFYSDSKEEMLQSGAIGFDFNASIGTQWKMRFTQAFFQSELDQFEQKFFRQNSALPRIGRASGISKANGSYTNAFVEYKAKKFFTFSAGYGRQFIGDGYRSLLLSDASGPSPFAKISAEFWRIKYTSLFNSHQQIYGVEENSSLFQRKYSATHYLDIQISNWLNIGLFETVIWQSNEGNYKRRFDLAYLNPVIFYRPVEFSLGSSDNVIVGTNIKFRIKKNHIVYSQIVLDEFLLAEIQADISQVKDPDTDIQSGWWANKYGVQFGYRYFDCFGIENLQTRLEYNFVRPFTYAHSNPVQSYTNNNISLAHPMGANFNEYLILLTYSPKKWMGSIHLNYSERGESIIGSNFGENPLRSNEGRTKEYENFTGQGVLNKQTFTKISLGYMLIPQWNTFVDVSFINRENESSISSNEQVILIGIRSNLWNNHLDY